MSDEKQDPIYQFKKPLDFDGGLIESIDLSEINNITRQQMQIVLNRFTARKRKKKAEGQYFEDFECLLEVYCVAAGKPFDFFSSISGKDFAILPLSIMGFLGD